MYTKIKRIIAIWLSMFILFSMVACGIKSKDDNMYFVFDGDTLKFNNDTILETDLNCFHTALSISDQGNIVYFNDSIEDEKDKDFYTYNPFNCTVRRLNAYRFIDKAIIDETGIDYDSLAPLWIVFYETDNMLYFLTYTSSECDYFRIVKINMGTGEISYTPEIYSFVFDSNNSFAVNKNGNVFYESRDREGITNIYMYDFELCQESLYISNAKHPKSSSDGKYLFYSGDIGYIVRDLEESKEYCLSYEDFCISQTTFSSSGNSLISVEYVQNPWSLFSSTKIDVRQIDFKTGKSSIILRIQESGNKGILYYEN